MDPSSVQGQALATAEWVACEVLEKLSGGCAHTRLLAGSTKRGPAFVYLSEEGRTITVVSIPVGGLRRRDLGDPTSRTRIASFPLTSVTVETGAYIESDGTVRALFTMHVPGDEDLEWELIAESPVAVGTAVRALREALHH